MREQYGTVGENNGWEYLLIFAVYREILDGSRARLGGSREQGQTGRKYHGAVPGPGRAESRDRRGVNIRGGSPGLAGWSTGPGGE